LRDHTGVTQIEEDEASQIASSRHPSRQKDGLSLMRFAEFTAIMRPLPLT